ncbi:MAG: hypothetical protein ACE5GT_10120 [Rhodospirillales bacterium]
MQTKDAKPATRKKPIVATTIRLKRDTFDMLFNVALARQIQRVASASRHAKIRRRDRAQSVAAVIEDLIERHRLALETEAEMIKGQRKKP